MCWAKHTTNRITTMENYAHYKILKEAGITLQHRIAGWPMARMLADLPVHRDGSAQSQRGQGEKVFATLNEAKQWLSKDPVE